MIKEKNSFETVYEVVKLIPSGRVTTYGAIAAYLGIKSGARFVGWAMNAAITHKELPAHRVVNRYGLLTGKNHFSSPVEMEQLLVCEGINVENDIVCEFEKVFWDPLKELF